MNAMSAVANRRLLATISSGVIRRHFQSHVPNLQAYQWVPIAYRGAKDDDKNRGGRHTSQRRASRPPRGSAGGSGGKNSYNNSNSNNNNIRNGQTNKHHNSRSQVSSSHRRTSPSEEENYKEMRKAARKETKERLEMEEKSERLVGIYDDLVRLSKNYRACFSSEPVPLGQLRRLSRKHHSYVEEKEHKRKAQIQSLIDQLKAVFVDIHQSEAPVEWPQIESSEDLFRGLSRMLQDITLLSSGLYGYSANRSVTEFVDLSEVSLRLLDKFNTERSFIVDATRQWIALGRPRSRPSPPSEDLSARREAGLKGWIYNFMESYGKRKPVVVEQPMAHEDTDLRISPRLFRAVIESMASTVESDLDDATNERSDTNSRALDHKAYNETAQRMVSLLDLLPSSWSPDSEIMKRILQVLGRVGTFESAEACHDIFLRDPGNQQRLRFSLVLQAYLEAAKNEKDQETRNEVVHQALSSLNQQWDTNWPSHRVERIMHCSIVLNCMSVARLGPESNMCELADKLMSRTLGAPTLAELKNNIVSSKGDVDMQTLPLVNFLARIYAVYGDHARVEEAKQILRYLMQHDKQGVGRSIVFPNSQTFEDILKAILRRYENKEGSSPELQESEKDLDFSKAVLDYMLRRDDSESWPSSSIFQQQFRLLTTLVPKDIGERADHLLDCLEIRKAISRSDDFVVGRDMYHKVLRCYLLGAKVSSQNKPWDRAVRLLERLEMQSTPLMLTRSEVRKSSTPNMYDLSLRPAQKTYQLVLQICNEAEDPEDKERAVEVASRVYLYIIRSDLPLDAKEKLLAESYSFLPDDSDRRHQLEAQIQDRMDELKQIQQQ